MGDDDLYDGKVIKDKDGEYMVKKSGDEYKITKIWNAPKESEKGGLEDDVESYPGYTVADTGFPYHEPSDDNDAGCSGG